MSDAKNDEEQLSILLKDHQWVLDFKVTINALVILEALDIMTKLMNHPTDADRERAKEFVSRMSEQVNIFERNQ